MACSVYNTSLSQAIYAYSSVINFNPLSPPTEPISSSWSNPNDILSVKSHILMGIEMNAPLVQQTIELTAGTNWFSTYLDITLEDLKAALTATTSGTAITIKSSEGQSAVYSPRTHTWSGQLTLMDVVMRYTLTVAEDCEITLEGRPINPANHPITILGGGAKTWIGFPFSESLSPSIVFAGFAINGDKIKSGSGANTTYARNLWSGQLSTLEPGQGYMYTSSETAEDRVFIFPASSK